MNRKDLERVATQLLSQNGYDQWGNKKTPRLKKQRKWERKNIKFSQGYVEKSKIFFIPQIEETDGRSQMVI